MSETGDLILDQGSFYFGRLKTDQNQYLDPEAKNKEKFTRNEVLESFNSGYQRFENSAKEILLSQGFSDNDFDQWKNGEELSPDKKDKLLTLDTQTKKTLSDFRILAIGKGLTIDQNRDYFKHNFDNFSARERIPVEGLLRFLHNEISQIKNKVKNGEISEGEANSQISAIYKEGYIVYKSSRLANRNIRVKKGADAISGTKAHTRAQAEAKYISLDPLRSRNNLGGDEKLRAEFLDGINIMQNRRELILPKEALKVDDSQGARDEYPYDNSDESDLGVGNPFNVKEKKPKDSETEYTQDNSDTSDLGPNNPYSSSSNSKAEEAQVSGENQEGAQNQEEEETAKKEESFDIEENLDQSEASQKEEPIQEEIPITPEEIRREFYIVNRSVDVHKRAAEIAETQLREEMRRGKWYNPKDFFRRTKLRIAEEYYRRQYKDRALKAMLENNNSYLDFDCVHNAVIDANRNRTGQKRSGEAVITQLKSGELIAGQQVKEAQGELKKAIIDQIIKPITDGNIKSENEIRKVLQDFVKAHQNDQDIQDLFGRDTSKYNELANFFATDLWEMGSLVKQDLNTHKYALESIDEHLQIKLANSSWAAETEANFNFVDKAVAWAQDKPWKGAILNPASIGVITSVAYSAVTLLGKGLASKELNLIAPGIGSLVGGSFAALRRFHDLQHDIASHRVEMAYGNKMAPNSKRREAIERFNYNTATIQDLIIGGGTDLITNQDRESVEDLLKQDLSQDVNQQKIINRIAEINQRLDLSVSQHIDLVTASDGQQQGLDVGRMELLKNVAQMKIRLKGAGLSDVDINTHLSKARSDWEQVLLQNKEEQDRSAQIYKIKQAALSGVFGSAVGMVSFFGTQEALALGQRAMGMQVGATQLERLMDRLGDLAAGRPHIETPTVGVLTNLFHSGGNANLGSDMQMQINPNTHEISIIDSNNLRHDIPLLTLDNDGTIDVNGKLPADIETAFHNAGFKIDNASGPLLLDTGTPTYSSFSTGHETFIPKGTQWLNDNGKWDLVLSSDNSKVLIDNANFNPDGTLSSYDQASSLLNTNQVDFGSASKTILEKIVLGGQQHEDLTTGFKTVIPNGSKWIQDQSDPSKWDLVMENDSSKILVDNVSFDDNGVIVDYDEQSSLITDQKFINIGKFRETETTPEIWNKAGDYRVVHAKSEVALPIRNSVFATGESDNPLGVRFEFPDSAVHNPNTGLTEYLHDAASGKRLGILLQVPHYGQNGEDVGIFVPGHWDSSINKFVVEFDPTDTTTVINLPQGGTTTMAQLAKNFLNEGKLSEYLPDSEMAYDSRAAFNLANPDGLIEHQGRILAGYLDPNSKSYGHNAYDGAFIATHAVHGSNPVANIPEIEKILQPPEINGILESEIKETIIPPSFEPIDIRGSELIPPLDAPPGIPIPWAPRWPLEKLMTNELPIYYGMYDSNISESRKKLFEEKRSLRLKENSGVELDAKTEVIDYLSRQDSKYKEEIAKLAESVAQPSDSKDLIICIPVAGHQEGKNIYDSLKNYTYQDIDRDKFEIQLFVNYPEKDQNGKVLDAKETLIEIERFKKDYPDMPITVITKKFKVEEAKIGSIRKFGTDIALYRYYELSKRNKDLIVVSNDADLKGISPSYVSNFINVFRKNPKTDGLLGQLDWDPEAYAKYPLVHIGTRLFQYLAIIGRHRSERMPSSGANFALKASIYAGIGGYLEQLEGGEDIAIGQAILEARKSTTSIKYAGAGVSRLYTSARRAIKSLEKGLSPVEQWNKGFSAFDDEIRQFELNSTTDIDYDDSGIVEKLKNDLEIVINRTLDVYEEGERLGKDAPYYKKALQYLGIEYKLNDEGRVVILNINKIAKNLKRYQKIAVLMRDLKSHRGSIEEIEEIRNKLREIQNLNNQEDEEEKKED